MARVFVTGATGFIGAHLTRALLAEGNSVHIFTKSSSLWRLRDCQDKLTIHTGDIVELASLTHALTESAPEYVFHLAGYGARFKENDPNQITEIIERGTENVLAACATLPVFPRVIHAGSASEYGKKDEPLQEDMVTEPVTAYGKAKRAATQRCEDARLSGHPVTTLRLFNAYGEYGVPDSFISATILALLRHQAPTLSNPDTVRDFVYVHDIVDAFLRARTALPGIYNIGTGIQTSLQDTVALIQNSLHNTQPLVWGGEAGRGNDSSFYAANRDKAKEALGWEPQTALADGVARTVAWFAANIDLYA